MRPPTPPTWDVTCPAARREEPHDAVYDAGTKAVTCERCGFSASESVADVIWDLREEVDDLRQLFAEIGQLDLDRHLAVRRLWREGTGVER